MSKSLDWYLQWVVTPLFLSVMLILGSQYEKPKIGVTYDEQVKAYEIQLAKQVAEAKKKKSRIRPAKPRHKAQTLDDGLKSNDDIRDLMKEFRGFL